MPIYEYRCKSCGQFELIQKFSEELELCPKCKEPVERLVSPGSFILKGSGWTKKE